MSQNIYSFINNYPTIKVSLITNFIDALSFRKKKKKIVFWIYRLDKFIEIHLCLLKLGKREIKMYVLDEHSKYARQNVAKF